MKTEDQRRAPIREVADLLTAAAVILGIDAGEVADTFGCAGMPNKYRAGLLAARASAARFLQGSALGGSRQRAGDRRVDLAQQVVEITHAIIFGMRNGLPRAPIFEAAESSLRDQITKIAPELLDAENLEIALRQVPR